MLARLGRWCFDRPWQVVAGWIALVVALAALLNTVGTDFAGGPEIPASDSASGLVVLEEHFGGFGAGARGTLVFRADAGVADPEIRATMTGVLDEIAAIEDVTVISPYERAGAHQTAPGGEIAFADLLLSDEISEADAGAVGQQILDILEERGLDERADLQVEVGGESLTVFEPPESEALGLAFAVIILTIALGSVLAMGLTTGVALIGVGAGVILFQLMTHVLSSPEFAVTIGVMIGLGVGIDYALFIVTRYREAIEDGLERGPAVEAAIDTAGRAVLFAGVTVVVSLLGMLLMGLEFISGMGLGAASVVTAVMAASVTLLPAVLGLAGDRVGVTTNGAVLGAGLLAVGLAGIGLGIGPLRLLIPAALVVFVVTRWIPSLHRPRAARVRPRPEDTVWYRMSHRIQAKPWRYAIGTTVVLVILSLPVFGLRLGFSDEGNYPEDTTTRRAYDLLSEGFGPGSNGPLLVVAELDSPADFDAFRGLADPLQAADGVQVAVGPIPNDPAAPAAAQFILVPTTSPQDEGTVDLIETLREDVIPAALDDTELDVFVTGRVAASIDFTDFLGRRLILFLGVVLVLSFLLLMAVFRSLLVPVKAVVMNILSISAAYGITIAIFQWGWLAEWFNTTGGPIEPFVPMMLFAIVFGLSMDYEVFLLSRIKEEYERTGDPRESVASGLTVTAGVITAAASIMVVVFGSFLLEDQRVVKLFGVGLSLAILLDATLVRMLLVPSTMQLLGDRNWWLPAWLDRLLPQLRVEGTAIHAPTTGIASHEARAGERTEPDDPDVARSNGASNTDDPAARLHAVEGLGPARAERVLAAYGSVEEIRAADVAGLMSVEGVGAVLAQRILDGLDAPRTKD